MDIVSLINLLDHPHQASHWLGRWGLRDAEAGRSHLSGLSGQGLPLDLLATICDQLSAALPATSNPDEVLAALTEFIGAARSPLALASLFERDRLALPTLLGVLDLGSIWRRVLVEDPEAFDLLRMTDGQPVGGQWLKAEICGELVHFSDERHILAGLRRIKQREQLRILYGDVLKRQRYELVTEQLTFLADAVIEAAVQAARRRLGEPRGDGKRMNGAGGRFAVIALGRLGGLELDYNDSLEVLLIHEPLPDDDHARRNARDYFDRLGRLVVRYLSENQDGHVAYQIRTPVVIEHQAGPVAAVDDVLGFLDGFGRTWHREAMIKARAVAGDLDLAGHLLRQLQPWIYRRYLNQPDETGIRALKRRLERRAAAVEQEPGEPRDLVPRVARQIEEVVQFLQLLNGGDLPIVRATNTLAAIAGLEQAGVLSVPERTTLEDSYRTLREAEHRVQRAEREIALSSAAATALDRARATTLQLLASAFAGDETPAAEVDLLLDPQSTSEDAALLLRQYGFKNSVAAYEHLQSLADEHVPFLSTRRCRHFLATIAPRLLSAAAATPDPDYTLANLSRVSDSIGGKGVLWELFNFNRPSLELYVRLCAASPYLSGILTSYPGMVDELVDSLQLSRLATLEELDEMLNELLRSGGDLLPVLHGFKNSQHLQIGVRELLGKESVESIQTALSNVAEAVVAKLIASEYQKLVEKFGQPTIGFQASDDRPCRYTVLATGKLGAWEPNYHRDLELVFVYEADGMTQLASRGRRVQKTANSHFFSQLAQRVLGSASQLTQWGRLYPLEIALRSPSGGLAISAAELQSHFEAGRPSFADWQSLLKSRPIPTEGDLDDEIRNLIRALLCSQAAASVDSREVRTTRYEREQSASAWNVKRGVGGWIDIEFLASLLELQSGNERTTAQPSSTVSSLEALRDAGRLTADDAASLADNYRWLRQVDSALRLLLAEPRHDLPEDETALGKAALLVRCESAEQLQARTLSVMEDNRRRFERILGSVPSPLPPDESPLAQSGAES